MGDAPERIWIAGSLQECGSYYAEAVEAEGEHGGTAVLYIRADLLDAAVNEALERAAKVAGDAAVAALLRQNPDANPVLIQMTRQNVARPIRAMKKEKKE